MSTKTYATIAALATFILLILLAVISVFIQMIVLNGAGESEGFTAMSISVGCQSVGLLLSVILVRLLTKLFIDKYSWNAALAIIASIIAGTTLGGIIALISGIISIPLAGIK